MSGRSPRHARVIHRHSDVRHVQQLNVENQIRLGWNHWVRWIGSRTTQCAVRQLPRDKDTPLAANLHAGDALVKARNQASIPLWEAERLRIA